MQYSVPPLCPSQCSHTKSWRVTREAISVARGYEISFAHAFAGSRSITDIERAAKSWYLP